MFVLNLFKIVFIGLLILAIVGATHIRRSLKRFNQSRQMRDQADQARRRTAQRGSTRRHATIVDRRTPEQANRKIIPDNQGEYVEYTEVKE